MTTVGYDKHLYLLPFDHHEVAVAKQVIYDGFKAAIATGVPRDRAGIIVDEQFGAAILRDAVGHGYLTACSVEKARQEEFEFAYGADFRQHIEAFHPTFCKALVRYNPEGDRLMIKRQTARLRRLSDYLHEKDRSLFMLQLLVPPEKAQLDWLRGAGLAYDMELRPRLMLQAIEELQSAGVEPDVWKVEGLDRRVDCERIVAAARQGGRKKVSCIVLGRGEDEMKVRRWLSTAARVRGFIGFAVGRTNFQDPIVAWRQKAITREEAVAAIARRYWRCIDIFEGKTKLCAAA